MTSASDEKWRPFNCFFSRVGLLTYQHPCKIYILEPILDSLEYTPVGYVILYCVVKMVVARFVWTCSFLDVLTVIWNKHVAN